MGFFSRLFGKKKKGFDLTHQEYVDAGVCPNCWGKQEYDGAFVDYEKDLTKSNINHDKSSQKAFVTQFVETNISGIRLKKDGDQSTCPSCKQGFKVLH